MCSGSAEANSEDKRYKWSVILYEKYIVILLYQFYNVCLFYWEGVESVTIDLANDRVTVKGLLDPEKLVVDVYKKTKKQAIVVKDEEKKEEGKKEEEKKEDKETKKEGEEAKEDDQDNKGMDIMKNEYYGPKSYTEYSTYVPQMFSDENPNACSVM